ncbi:MAG: transposase [Dysgonamonadaceae bacterium]|jgi:REP element-mobilizing transposase RayT|nr:transposase [Dysgonamonadaceae bacterium]
MKVEYNNLHTHFVFTTLNRTPLITENFRERIEKYITGIVNNNGCKMYSIYANPERVHFLVSHAPGLDDEYEGYVKFYQQTIRKKTNEQ